MSARSKARKRALDILFQADVRGDDLPVILAAEAQRAAGEPSRQASWLYARDIVDGVIDHQSEIDEQIVTHAREVGGCGGAPSCRPVAQTRLRRIESRKGSSLCASRASDMQACSSKRRAAASSAIRS
ncbi:MAG: nusB [Microbacterium sp.]|nr:nusB [Microbacterium sp.]